MQFLCFESGKIVVAFWSLQWVSDVISVSKKEANMLWRSGRVKRNARVRAACQAPVEAMETRLLLTVFTVNSLSDAAVNFGDSAVTLRDAIEAANRDVAVSPGGPVGSGADEIRFNVNFLLRNTITLNQGGLSIRSDLTITGPGAARLAISGNTVTRVFDVTDFSAVQRRVTISGVRISNGNSTTLSGGGILNRENLTVKDCTISANRAAVD